MNTQLNTVASRIACAAAALGASLLVTFTGLQVIANYALPAAPLGGAAVLAAAPVAMPATVR